MNPMKANMHHEDADLGLVCVPSVLPRGAGEVSWEDPVHREVGHAPLHACRAIFISR